MKKSFIASILLLQMFIQPSYADESDDLSTDFSNVSVTASYRAAVAGNQKALSDYSFPNHGGSLGVYYPVPGFADVGVEVDVLNPKGIFLDRKDTEANMLASPVLCSGILKLQKKVTLADDFGLIGGIGLGPTYIVFDTPTGTGTDKRPFEKRTLNSKWSFSAVGDLSISVALTEYVYGTIGYSLQYSPVGEVTSEEKTTKVGDEEASSAGKADASAVFAHALKVGISTAFGAFLA